MYVYLGMSGRYQKNQLVRKLFLESLQDPVEGVRVRAIEGLQCYDDPEVTRALVSALHKGYYQEDGTLGAQRAATSGDC